MRRARIGLVCLMGTVVLGWNGPVWAETPATAPIVVPATAPATQAAAATRPAPLFDDLGDHHHPITTSSPLAQQYFDQGLRLAYGFNHAEAIRSFEGAAATDPQCAMAWWGVALASGPNINRPMTDEDVPKAWVALTKAQQLAPNASEKERAYIAALAKRYGPEPVKDRSALDQAYADAMRQVAQRHPDDLDAATLFAEALMDTMPWDYWTKDKQPKPATVELLKTLEGVLAQNPDHPGAIHYYIHAVEAAQPAKALLYADRLGALVPGAGHLVHMPSHIYLRVGLYREATLVNERAAQADESYINQCNAQGFYATGYYPHNVHFLWYTTSMEGRSQASIDAARKVADHAAHFPGFEAERLRPLAGIVLVRFGKWDQVLKEPVPPADDLFGSAMSNFARGIALVRTGQVDAAQQESAALQRLATGEQVKTLDSDSFPGSGIVQIASHVLAGELALKQGRQDEAIRELQTAARLEDELPYMEPPFWYWPTRHHLGVALLETGRPAEAEAAYREDLERNPHNGWALFGLTQALRKQGKDAQADEVQRQFDLVWMRADTQLSSSRF